MVCKDPVIREISNPSHYLGAKMGQILTPPKEKK